MKILELVSKEKLAAQDILEVISVVGENKDIIIVKNDGIRDENQYSVIIIASGNPEKSFRFDSNLLQDAMKKALQAYVNERYVK